VPDQVRVFVLTVFVVDDIAALVVIAVVYSDKVDVMPLVIAIIVFAAMLVCYHILRIRNQLVYFVLGVVVWAAMLASGVDPVVAGLAIGLTTPAYTPTRDDLDRATRLVRSFREQPTSQLARSATTSLTSSLSANERLQGLYHPWTSYVIVPLFALANAGIVINGHFLAHAYTTPVTLGILLGYLVGKPIAIVGTSWLTSRMSHGRVRAPVGWAGVLGSGTIAGIGFTVTLLIATRAFHGAQLADAKLGALSAVAVAAAVTWGVFRVIAGLSLARRARALLGDTDVIPDLCAPVDMARDHVRGPETASVTIVEYGDFECPFCGQAEPVVRELIRDEDLRYVWRHLPLVDVHPHAQLAAEAAEAAAAQGAFWRMHDLLLDRQAELKIMNLLDYARELGLDTERFHSDVMRHAHAQRIARDVESADASGVSGTPTFFINGQRHYGAYDIATLTTAVKTARVRAKLAASGRPSVPAGEGA
jgi:protein-disulfide isomerase